MAIRIWDGSGWSGSNGLRILENKCLVEIVEDTFNGRTSLRMHDHLRDMGREIADQRLPRRLYAHGEATLLGGVDFQNMLAVTTNSSRSLRGVDYSYHINGGSIFCFVVNECVEANFYNGSKHVLYLSWHNCEASLHGFQWEDYKYWNLREGNYWKACGNLLHRLICS
eukprot:Gb_00050 [translate_table: standard]